MYWTGPGCSGSRPAWLRPPMSVFSRKRVNGNGPPSIVRHRFSCLRTRVAPFFLLSSLLERLNFGFSVPRVALATLGAGAGGGAPPSSTLLTSQNMTSMTKTGGGSKTCVQGQYPQSFPRNHRNQKLRSAASPGSNPSTVCIHNTEVVLGVGMSLLGGLPKPAHGLGMVLLHPLTVFIHDTQVGLSAGMSLLGGLPVPARGLGMVLLHPLTVFIHNTEVILTAGMSLLGCAPPQPKHLVHFPLLRLEAGHGRGKRSQVGRLVGGLARGCCRHSSAGEQKAKRKAGIAAGPSHAACVEEHAGMFNATCVLEGSRPISAGLTRYSHLS